MNTSVLIEVIGYFGSALVLVSFLMTSVVKLRVVNTIGSAIFAVYALIIHSYPTAIMNLCLVAINLHNLYRLRGSAKKTYSLVEVKPDDAYLQHVLAKYKADILACFSLADAKPAATDTVYIITCDDAIAGVTFGKLDGAVYDVALDYATPSYRDCSVGRFLCEQLAASGVKELRYSGPSENHKAYLKKLNYTEENGTYVKRI